MALTVAFQSLRSMISGSAVDRVTVADGIEDGGSERAVDGNGKPEEAGPWFTWWSVKDVTTSNKADSTDLRSVLEY